MLLGLETRNRHVWAENYERDMSDVLSRERSLGPGPRIRVKVIPGFAGLLLGLLYLGCGRNLTVRIVAHGVSNTLAFLPIFFDRYPGV